MDFLASILDNILAYMTGSIAKTLFSIAVVACGWACSTGKIHKGWLMAAAVGAGFTFGGKYLVGLFTGM